MKRNPSGRERQRERKLEKEDRNGKKILSRKGTAKSLLRKLGGFL